MDEKVIISKSKLTNLADTTRKKLGGNEKLTVDEINDKIENIYKIDVEKAALYENELADLYFYQRFKYHYLTANKKFVYFSGIVGDDTQSGLWCYDIDNDELTEIYNVGLWNSFREFDHPLKKGAVFITSTSDSSQAGCLLCEEKNVSILAELGYYYKVGVEDNLGFYYGTQHMNGFYYYNFNTNSFKLCIGTGATSSSSISTDNPFYSYGSFYDSTYIDRKVFFREEKNWLYVSLDDNTTSYGKIMIFKNGDVELKINKDTYPELFNYGTPYINYYNVFKPLGNKVLVFKYTSLSNSKAVDFICINDDKTVVVGPCGGTNYTYRFFNSSNKDNSNSIIQVNDSEIIVGYTYLIVHYDLSSMAEVSVLYNNNSSSMSPVNFFKNYDYIYGMSTNVYALFVYDVKARTMTKVPTSSSSSDKWYPVFTTRYIDDQKGIYIRLTEYESSSYQWTVFRYIDYSSPFELKSLNLSAINIYDFTYKSLFVNNYLLIYSYDTKDFDNIRIGVYKYGVIQTQFFEEKYASSSSVSNEIFKNCLQIKDGVFLINETRVYYAEGSKVLNCIVDFNHNKKISYKIPLKCVFVNDDKAILASEYSSTNRAFNTLYSYDFLSGTLTPLFSEYSKTYNETATKIDNYILVGSSTTGIKAIDGNIVYNFTTKKTGYKYFAKYGNRIIAAADQVFNEQKNYYCILDIENGIVKEYTKIF